MIDALVFDFDGLILDTESVDFQAWRETYEFYGAELPMELWGLGVGIAISEFDPADYLEQQAGRGIDIHEAKARYRDRMQALLNGLTPLPGVLDYIESAKSMGIKLGVASSAPISWVEGHLKKQGIYDDFEVVRCFEHVDNAKPAPDLYLLACADLGVAVDRAIAFEDSPNGVLAAKRAGMYCVAVPNSVTAQLEIRHADRVIRSMAEEPLAGLIASVTERAPLAI